MSQWKSIVVFVLFLLSSAPFAQAAGLPGRFLVAPRGDIILECNVDGSNCFHLTGAVQAAGDPGGGDQDVSLAFSPSVANDGTIAFQAAYATDGSCAGTGTQGFCVSHVFMMDADGTNVRQITFNPPFDPNAFCYGGDFVASVSPDASMVAFVSARNCAYDATHTPYAHAAVYVVNVDGSNLRQVTPFFYDSDGNPHGDMFAVAWSPDSAKLAFKGTAIGTVCGTSNGSPIEFLGVGTINVDGTGLAWIACDSVNAAGGAVAIDWSPDGSLIADARDSVDFGEPAIRITDLSGQGRFAAGLTLAQLGVQYSGGQNSGQFCTGGNGSWHCFHFSPDSARIAYVNNFPSDNSSFAGNSTINVGGTGRLDSFNFGTTYSGNGLERRGLWWSPGSALPPAGQITLSPGTVEVWPGFSQQLIPSLFDANGALISHTARAFGIHYVFGSCGIEIGPYGLAMFSSLQSGTEGSTISAANEGLTSNSVTFKCWSSSPCTYSLSAASDNLPSSGGSDSVTVITNPGGNTSTCPWNAESNDPWIEITSPFLGVGAGTSNLGFTVAANNGPARQGTLTVAGQTFTVNQASVTPPSADLSISKAVSPGQATVGSDLTYTITVTNNGPDSATGVSVNDALPASMTFKSVTKTQGTCSATNNTVTCNLGTISVSGSATVTIVVTPTQTGVIGNTATVTGNETDPNPANNSATATVTINPAPQTLASLSPALLWLGQTDSVKNLRFDLLAEVLLNNNVVGSGQLVNLQAGGTDFGSATLETISLPLASPVQVPSGSTLAIRVSVRSSCSSTKSGAGGARLWYNGRPVDSGKPASRDAGSRFDATIGGTNKNYFLRSNFVLDTTAGSARESIDMAVDGKVACPGRPFTAFGTWSLTLP